MGDVLRLVLSGRVAVLRSWGDLRRAQDACPGARVLASPRADHDARALEVVLEGWAGSVVLTGESPEVTPLVLGQDWADRLWLAYGSRVYAFPGDPDGVAWVDLDTVVDDVRLVREAQVLVAVCETGVFGIGEDLGLRWSLPADVITSHRWLPDRVQVEQLDGPGLEIALGTGTVL